MAKQVLITGCSGFVASALIKYLSKKNYKINCINKNSKKEEIKKTIKDSDIIVHTAAILNPFDKKIWKINVDYTRFLVIEAKKYNKKFIYLSSQNVLFGKDPYSITKRQAESLVKILKNYVILRPTIIYGENEKRYIGKLLNLMRKSPIIPVIGTGKKRLQPLYIWDLVKIIEVCIKGNIKGTFLIAGGSIINYNDLIDLMTNKMRLKRMKLHLPIRLIRPFTYILQNLLKNPPITTIQLINSEIDQNYDVKYIKKIFKIKLKSIEEGLDLTIK